MPSWNAQCSVLSYTSQTEYAWRPMLIVVGKSGSKQHNDCKWILLLAYTALRSQLLIRIKIGSLRKVVCSFLWDESVLAKYSALCIIRAACIFIYVSNLTVASASEQRKLHYCPLQFLIYFNAGIHEPWCGTSFNSPVSHASTAKPYSSVYAAGPSATEAPHVLQLTRLGLLPTSWATLTWGYHR